MFYSVLYEFQNLLKTIGQKGSQYNVCLFLEINWRLKEALIVSKSFPLSQISQKKRIGYKCIKYHIIVQKLSLTIFKTSRLRLINENLYKRTLFRISWTIIVTMATSIAKCCNKTKAFHTNLKNCTQHCCFEFACQNISFACDDDIGSMFFLKFADLEWPI